MDKPKNIFNSDHPRILLSGLYNSPLLSEELKHLLFLFQVEKGFEQQLLAPTSDNHLSIQNYGCKLGRKNLLPI